MQSVSFYIRVVAVVVVGGGGAVGTVIMVVILGTCCRAGCGCRTVGRVIVPICRAMCVLFVPISTPINGVTVTFVDFGIIWHSNVL